MSAALAPVADKLAKLIPRLGSDHDGEVVATVAAIRRTLAGAGLDLHDIAKAIVPGEAPDPAALDDREMLRRIVENSTYVPTDWEASFLAGCLRRLRKRGSVTAKQLEVLRELYGKAFP